MANNISKLAHVGASAKIGDNVTIHPFAYIDDNVEIGDGCEIMSYTSIVRGTRIGKNNKIYQGSIIGADPQDFRWKGDNCVLGNGALIAGDAEVDNCTILSSGVMLHENSRVGEWVLIKGGCRITGNVPPYVIMAHNPASYFGVNAIILRKGGFTEEQIDNIAKAYRHIYQTGTSVFNALRRIEADVTEGTVRDHITDFIRNVNLKIVAIPRDLE